jgi:hypothetical protein
MLTAIFSKSVSTVVRRLLFEGAANSLYNMFQLLHGQFSRHRFEWKYAVGAEECSEARVEQKEWNEKGRQKMA